MVDLQVIQIMRITYFSLVYILRIAAVDGTAHHIRIHLSSTDLFVHTYTLESLATS